MEDNITVCVIFKFHRYLDLCTLIRCVLQDPIGQHAGGIVKALLVDQHLIMTCHAGNLYPATVLG